MRLLAVLPGTPVHISTEQRVAPDGLIELKTLMGEALFFSKIELGNNLTTIDFLEKVSGWKVDIVSFADRKNPISLWRSGKKLSALVKQNNYDGAYLFWGGPSAWIASKFCPVPLIVCLLGSDLMGSYTPDGRKTFFGKLLRFFSVLACQNASGVVVMSKKMKQLLPAKIANKVAVIPEGVNIQKFSFLDKATCRERLKWSADEKVILFFNNGSFVKNLPLAQQSLDLVKKQYPETRLLQISSVPNSELIYYYNAADLLLITSFHEGSNNSIKEALACNCPVVATNVGDADERLKDASPSFCVNSYHPEEIAASIELILKDGKRSNGRKRVEEVSVENVSKKLADFIKQIVGRK